ncbi:pyridoxamine 5'-phosphate oxidase family protein [Bacillus licheniformis]|jgi:general stress protein 26|uniref:FMN-binding split barrel domain protein YdaG n=3 Tax=Bacillus TaxID=1386 RepID=Q65N96_BACLD|nr:MULTISPECIES: pyridoxamine 5'-phosphate oxidase family protein [Bacillus]MBJ7884227.1 pyridoxamine 5'-phosphate oxidase family protein [Bacillaceae bacterium HSR45]MBY8349103.1 general stress protein [Bacillus sp. PCH94]MDP4080914.1 pyridoxamine 5'-phosphate oxidase family protein [Bacillota bacterium]AAU22108.1 FMN-binding split barrel domain protein YdaG [Bacillus licheniformis DSM 13 = ATCC 14580]AAU39468.1 putative general stress protein YdaG [Bacillus licheniformis DSM 13 = ATCC 14580]
MDQQQLKNKVLDILDHHKIGSLATVESGKPHSRYMTFFHDGLTLYTPTSDETHKAEEIDNNPNVHVLLGYNGEGLGDAYLEITGTAKLNHSKDLKDKIWDERLEQWFDGKDDPNLTVLEIEPSEIRLMNEGESTPVTLDM